MFGIDRYTYKVEVDKNDRPNTVAPTESGVEDGAASDPKYRQFNDDLNTTLQSFAKSVEWADLVKWLSKLSKVFEKYPKSASIQPKLLLSKRLSQCLNASLPSGCHSHALDTYQMIFSRIGTERLSIDIAIYGAGLFPLFRYASTDVRFKMLQLFDKYLVPLGHNLNTSLNGIVSSLLPGLDEGSGELYESVRKTLNLINKSTSTLIFHQAIWKNLITTPYNRHAAIEYLIKHLPKDFSDVSIQDLYLPEKETLVAQAICQSLTDSTTLVQRSMLELITAFFPLSYNIFSGAALENIIKAAVSVVVSKDASLNKRLNSWLLGSDNDPNYFSQHGKQPTINAFKKLLNDRLHPIGTTANTTLAHKDMTSPFVILTYLFQKEQFQTILDGILLDILRCLYKFKEGYSFSKDMVKYIDELLASITDSKVVWTFVSQLLTFKSGSSVSEAIENVKLVECYLDVVPLSVEDVQSHHLPSLLLAIVRSMKSIIEPRDNNLIIAFTQLFESIDTFQDYFIMLSDYIRDGCQTVSAPLSSPRNYSFSTNTAAGGAVSPLPDLSHSATLTNSSDTFVILDLSLQVLVGLFQQFRASPTSSTSSPALGSTTSPKWFCPLYDYCMSENPYISCLAIRSFLSLVYRQGDSGLSRSIKNLVTVEHFTSLAKKLWSILEPQNCAVHYKVASLFLSLGEMNEEACATVISESMLDTILANRVEGYQKFALFWRLAGELGNTSLMFSNTLFLMLDSLHSDQPIIKLTGQTWLADGISKAERILDPLLRILLDTSTVRFNHIYQSMYDTQQVIYTFRILKAIIECDFKLFIQHVIEKPISKEIIQMNDAQTMVVRKATPSSSSSSERTPHESSGLTTSPHIFSNYSPKLSASIGGITETSSDFLFIPTNSYIDLLVVVALRFLQGMVPNSVDKTTEEGKTFVSQNDVVQISAAEFLQYLLAQTSIHPAKACEIANYIQEPILQNLAQAVSSSNMVLQVHLLQLLRSIVLIDSSSAAPMPMLPTSPQWANINSLHDSNGSHGSMGNTSIASITQSTMFLQTTVVGLIQPSTRFNIRFYWLDFITFCLPRMANSAQLPHVVTTIVNCIRDLLLSFDNRSLFDSLTSRDIIVLLKSLTYILKFSVLEPITPFVKVVAEDSQGSGRYGPLGGVRILTDFVKDVFTAETDPSTILTPLGKVRDELFKDLAGIITPLVKLWGPPKTASLGKMSMSTDVSSDTHNKYAIQDMILHVLDPLATKYPTQLVGAVIDIWQMTDFNNAESQSTRKVMMEILNSLESVREDSVFQSCFQILTALHTQERNKALPKVMMSKFTFKEAALYDFVYRYIEEYTTPFDGISQSLLAIVRQSLHSSNPMTYITQLQLIHLYVRKQCPEEKSKNQLRYKHNKRELQELIPKIVEACFMISGKSFNDISAIYIPPTGMGDGAPMRPSSFELRSDSPTTTSSGSSSSGNSVDDSPNYGGSRGRTSSSGEHDSGNYLKRETRLKTQVSFRSLVQLSTTLAPLLDTIFDDKERVAAILANSIYNVVPYLKSKAEASRENTYYSTCLLSSLSEYPYNIKSIKKEALELFFDYDFFKLDIKTLEQTSKCINQIMIHDKTALSDFIKILSKPWTAPSALTFVNKEAESINRAKQLKRLSFIILSGVENQYLSILPLVLEKIVESLRIPNATVLHLQVFQCLRVLLVRMSHENLRSFWPIIITELIDILSHAHDDNTPSELVLAACKFLDLALTLPTITEQFNLYEWVFIRGCFIKHQAAPFKPYVDSISQCPIMELNEDDNTPPSILTSSGVMTAPDISRQLARPCILIRSLSELANGYIEFKAYLSKFSIAIYKRHLNTNAVDLNYINELLCFDFCELDLTKLSISGDIQFSPLAPSGLSNILASDSTTSTSTTSTLPTTYESSSSTTSGISQENSGSGGGGGTQTTQPWTRTKITGSGSGGAGVVGNSSGFKSTTANFLERARTTSGSNNSIEQPTTTNNRVDSPSM
ncbi:hypothetical protein SAMD00019534_092860 [Acytostelium subglobosum LB1]|uniref:hypothetical protein n=1 Tax=Acytostelium subglobosum LB1 TaxID=1410327 RepID=UPI0006447E71|nr:hypothetical protein SAMD00019534_092860 [Acytostelium subglobosum LB1]GAM26111.1 hypothetical protein SAMD00019534_092860 [Acytostelium subglobosum LB1]|eukprot:XP_012751154.1 hypothetical protein SAMD00019534_092860 [Acytostelium subglobosum LB1]